MIELPDNIPDHVYDRDSPGNGPPVTATRIDPITKEESTVRLLNIDMTGPGMIIQTER